MTVEANRIVFIEALRSGEYLKCSNFEFDPKGRPPPGATGYCTLGLAYTLFGPMPAMQRLLALQKWQFIKIQEEWNNSPRTFPEIADLIESEMFGGVRWS